MWNNRSASIPAMADVPPQERASRIVAGRQLPIQKTARYYTVTGSNVVAELPAWPREYSVFLSFTGAPTFAHSARLLCPGAANVIFSPGDRAELVSEGNGRWRVFPHYQDVALLSRKNVLINGGFTVNRRVYASAGTLAAGSYAHDRWKGGASGGNYSFTQLASPTTITIATGKSLIQVVENNNVVGGTYVLSWSGTSVARIGLNSGTPSGNFAVSPILITGQTAGTTMSVEFTGADAVGGSSLATNTGTLGAVQLEAGSRPTAFEFLHHDATLALCRRYYETSYLGSAPGTAAAPGYIGWAQPALTTDNNVAYAGRHQYAMRVTPTLTIYGYSGTAGTVSNGAGTDLAAGSAGANNPSAGGFGLYNASGGAVTTNGTALFHFTAECEL